MEANYKALVVSRGWHVYGNTVWLSPKRGGGGGGGGGYGQKSRGQKPHG